MTYLPWCVCGCVGVCAWACMRVQTANGPAAGVVFHSLRLLLFSPVAVLFRPWQQADIVREGGLSWTPRQITRRMLMCVTTKRLKFPSV